MAGKLNGVIPATTPSGWRSAWLSTRVPTFSVISPFSRLGAPVANSTTSMPRVSSPWASDSTLPCSAVIAAAMRPASRSSKARKRFRMRARRSGAVPAQPGKAARAVAAASATSAAEASGTWPVTSPVAGL